MGVLHTSKSLYIILGMYRGPCKRYLPPLTPYRQYITFITSSGLHLNIFVLFFISFLKLSVCLSLPYLSIYLNSLSTYSGYLIC